MHVVMIDRGHVTDRRIVLEANVLQRLGHEVVLIACSSSAGRGPSEIDGLPIEWLAGPERVFSPARPIREEFRKPLLASLARLDVVRPIMRRFVPIRPLATLFSIFFCPYAGIYTLANRPIHSRAMQWLATVLAFFTLSPSFIGSFFRDGYREVFTSEVPPSDESRQEGACDDDAVLDEWETRVVERVMTMEKVDVVHVHDLPALNAAVAIKKKRSVRLVYDSHELYTYQLPSHDPTARKKMFEQEKALIQEVDHIIVVNEIQAEVMRFDFGVDDFTVVTNATDLPATFDYSKRYDLIREKTGIPADAKIILFQGGINHMRGHHLLLDGLALGRDDVHAVFLTWGQEIPEFREMARNLGIADRVHFLPAVPWNEVIYWAASCDAGIMPYQPVTMNILISSPNKMFEFIAACVPMIASSELLKVQEVMEYEGFGVTRQLRIAEDYAQAINEMFDEDLGGAARFKKNLIERRYRYLWSYEQRKLIDLYARIEENRGESTRVSRVFAHAG